MIFKYIHRGGGQKYALTRFLVLTLSALPEVELGLRVTEFPPFWCSPLIGLKDEFPNRFKLSKICTSIDGFEHTYDNIVKLVLVVLCPKMGIYNVTVYIGYAYVDVHT